MDFAETKSGAAREIALAFGVPPLLLGLPGDNTFRNYQEANRAFWRQTVIPLVVRLQKAFQAWAQPGFGPFRFDYNIDRIDALSSERAAEWRRIDAASFLTNDEKREAAGYGAAPKDASVVDTRVAQTIERRYAPDQPRDSIGRWTSGGGGAGVQSAFNADPNVARDADNRILPVQNRRVGPYRNATPAQLAGESISAERASEAISRVHELDPHWRPSPALTDPRDIESRISRNENDAREANARYSELLRDKYGDIALANSGHSIPSATLNGPRARVLERDDAETRRGAERENETADILWLNNHNVEQKPRVPGPKNPDYRIDGELFDNYAPVTNNVRNIWSYVARKISGKQADNIVINLRDSQATLLELDAKFRDYPIPGLNNLWVVDRTGKLNYLQKGI
jgi:hypothetical protein